MCKVNIGKFMPENTRDYLNIVSLRSIYYDSNCTLSVLYSNESIGNVVYSRIRFFTREKDFCFAARALILALR